MDSFEEEESVGCSKAHAAVYVRLGCLVAPIKLEEWYPDQFYLLKPGGRYLLTRRNCTLRQVLKAWKRFARKPEFLPDASQCEGHLAMGTVELTTWSTTQKMTRRI